MSQDQIYQMITDQIMANLQQGTIPWKKPWRSKGKPMNFHAGRAYSGINALLLNTLEFQSRYFLTYKQAQQHGGQVRKGESSVPVIFWKVQEKQAEQKNSQTGEKEIVKQTVPILRYYNVFNLDQINGIDDPDQKEEDKLDFEPIKEAEKIISNYSNKPEIVNGGKACYTPDKDQIVIPAKETFENEYGYYETIFHEMIHSTGHETRLNRDCLKNGSFGSGEYSKEELTAEIGSAYLCGEARIEKMTIENQSAYISNWLQVLKNNPKWVVWAGSKAEKACQHILYN